jgi:hypothetical protein
MPLTGERASEQHMHMLQSTLHHAGTKQYAKERSIIDIAGRVFSSCLSVPGRRVRW